MSNENMKHRQLGRKQALSFLVAGLLIIWLGLLVFFGWSLWSRASRLLQMASNPSALNISAMAQEVHGARQEVTTLRVLLAPVLWVGARMGGDFSVGEPLMDVAVESLAAGDEALTALAPALGDFGPASFSMSQMPRVLDALVTAKPALVRAEAHLDRASDTLHGIHGSFSPSVQKWVDQASKAVQFAQYGVGAAQIAPEVMGRDGTRTYLVLVQNSDELRATGGFISNVGRVVISHGNIITQTFEDTYGIDDFTKDYPYPPTPLQEYMLSEQWVFRDANWSPDFPTTARDAIYLYQIGRPGQVDGVIAINLMTVRMLMPGLEPLNIEGFAEPVTAANVEDLFRQSRDPAPDQTNQPQDQYAWEANRKQAIGAMARAMMDKLLSGKANWSRLAQGVSEALQQRQIIIYAAGAEDLLKQLGWDGSLRATEGDYLMMVDSNIGFTKANMLVGQQVDYHVTLDSNGNGHADVVINYAHHGTQSEIECKPYPPIEMVAYDTLANRCYYDYLRLYVPKGSILRAATAHPVPGNYLVSGKSADGKAETILEEVERTVFGQFFVVEYGKQLQTRFEYDLPVVVREVEGNQRYTLFLQKQSGTEALPVKVTLTLPPQSSFVSSIPPPASQSSAVLEFDMKLDVDQQIQVTYSLGR